MYLGHAGNPRPKGTGLSVFVHRKNTNVTAVIHESRRRLEKSPTTKRGTGEKQEKTQEGALTTYGNNDRTKPNYDAEFQASGPTMSAPRDSCTLRPVPHDNPNPNADLITSLKHQSRLFRLRGTHLRYTQYFTISQNPNPVLLTSLKVPGPAISAPHDSSTLHPVPCKNVTIRT